MKIILLFSLFASFSILHGIEIEESEPVHSGCWAKNLSQPRRVFLRCVKLGVDGRSFEQAIGEESIPISTFHYGHFVNDTSVRSTGWNFKNVSITEIAHLVTRIVFGDTRNVTLDENALERFPNLTELKIWGPPIGRGELGSLNLTPGVFRQTPRLEDMEIERMVISDESMPALLELKDRLERITITDVYSDVSLEDKVLITLKQFTALRSMRFNNCVPRLFPIDVIKGSAAVLNTFVIENCHLPRLEKTMFATTPNLTHLFLKRVKLVDLDPSAFDHNPQLCVVNLRDNNLESLPDGLFSSLKNLWEVTLEGNPRLIGSIDRSNFSHVQDFGNFRLHL